MQSILTMFAVRGASWLAEKAMKVAFIIPPEQSILDSDCSENEHGMKAQPLTVKNPLLVVCFVEVFLPFSGQWGTRNSETGCKVEAEELGSMAGRDKLAGRICLRPRSWVRC